MKKTADIIYALDKLYVPLHINVACFGVYFIGEETKALRSLQFSW